MTLGFDLTHETWGHDAEHRPPQHVWFLRGPLGVIQFKAGPHRRDCTICRDYPSISHFDPDGRCWQAWDLGYHSLTSRYDGQEERECDVLTTGRCYYDGTGLGAGELLDAWFESGCSLPWLELRLAEWYERWLGPRDEAEADIFASPFTEMMEGLRRWMEGGGPDEG